MAGRKLDQGHVSQPKAGWIPSRLATNLPVLYNFVCAQFSALSHLDVMILKCFFKTRGVCLSVVGVSLHACTVTLRHTERIITN